MNSSIFYHWLTPPPHTHILRLWCRHNFLRCQKLSKWPTIYIGALSKKAPHIYNATIILTAWISLFSVEFKLSSGIDSSIWNCHLNPTLKIFKANLGNSEHSNDTTQLLFFSAMNVWGIPDGLLNDREVKYVCFSLEYILKSVGGGGRRESACNTALEKGFRHKIVVLFIMAFLNGNQLNCL